MYIAAAWGAAGIAFAAGQKWPRQEMAFLILFFVTVNTHVYIFFDDLFAWLAISKEPALFACFLIYRSAIAPSVLTAASLAFYRHRKWLGVGVGGLVLAFIDAWSFSNNIMTSNGWNPLYAAAYFGVLQYTGIAALAVFRGLLS